MLIVYMNFRMINNIKILITNLSLVISKQFIITLGIFHHSTKAKESVLGWVFRAVTTYLHRIVHPVASGLNTIDKKTSCVATIDQDTGQELHLENGRRRGKNTITRRISG